MKIIRKGRLDAPTSTVKRLKCPNCSCIFEAEENEYILYPEEFMGIEIRARCPFCGKEGYKQEIKMRT